VNDITEKRPKIDTSMSESGDYGEPSSSTVVLPDPPAWLNIDAILSYDDRQRPQGSDRGGPRAAPGPRVMG
jgi:hypothetical protein